MSFIPCQNCRDEHSTSWHWYICKDCGFRICPDCYNTHSGSYATGGGSKCSQCMHGQLEGPKNAN